MYKYFKVVDTTKSDLREKLPLTKGEIEHGKEVIAYYKNQIDTLLIDIEFFKMQNYYVVHELAKNNIIIEME